MKIPKELPQFTDQRVLLVVTGKQVAALYEAQNGVMHKANDIRIPTPRYTDREGHFESRSGGMTIRSGSVYEDKNKKIRKDFIRELHRVLAHARKSFKPTRVYLFTPEYMKRYAQDAFPTKTREKILTIYEGNFTRLHPKELLEKIARDIEETHGRLSYSRSTSAARKIYRKTRKQR